MIKTMAIRFAQTNGYVLGWNWKEASEILRRNIRLPGEMSKEEKSFFSSRDFAEGYSQNLLKFGSNLIQNHNYSLAYSATGNIDTADGLTLDLFFIGKGLFFRRGSSSFRGVAVADESTTVYKLRPDIIRAGGRSGQLVKNLTGPANSVLKGTGRYRIFITDDAGKVIWDITPNRAKSVIHGKGFGPKKLPTQEQLNLINKLWGD
jgi:hypothetical protein